MLYNIQRISDCVWAGRAARAIAYSRAAHGHGSIGRAHLGRGLPAAAYRAAIRRGGPLGGPLGTRWSGLVECTRTFWYLKRPHRCHVQCTPSPGHPNKSSVMAIWPAPLSSLEFEFSVTARPSFGPPHRRRSCPHRSVLAASSSEPPNERGVGVPSSRSLATTSREAT